MNLETEADEWVSLPKWICDSLDRYDMDEGRFLSLARAVDCYGASKR